MKLRIDKTSRRVGEHKMPVNIKPKAIKQISTGGMMGPIKIQKVKMPSIKYGSFPKGHVY
jgi:hypothetical protein